MPDFFGYTVASVGDVDGDGVPDALIGAPHFEPGSSSESGAAFLYSGAGGKFLRRLDGQPASHFGSAMGAVGDLDGDGVSDFLVGAPFANAAGAGAAGSFSLFSGATQTLLFQANGAADAESWGAAVGGIGDFDRDGVPDFFVSAPGLTLNGVRGSGGVWVFSGARRTLLRLYPGPGEFARFGESVARVGDLDGDGIRDLLVGAPATSPGGRSFAGSAFAVSAAGGTILFRFDGPQEYDSFGIRVCDAGDLDGDGISDLGIGAPSMDVGGNAKAGSAFFYSGATGALLRRFDGSDHAQFFGQSLAGAGDVDGDGVDDILIGLPGFRTGPEAPFKGRADLYSGATGGLIHRFQGRPLDNAYGCAVAILGDVDGDGVAEFLIGASGNSGGGSPGSALIHRFDPFLHADSDSLSAARGGTVSFRLDYPLAEAGARYALLGSLTGLGNTDVLGACVPIVFDAFTGRMLGNPPRGFRRTRGVLDAAGDAAASFTAAPGALSHLVGRRVFFAALDFDTKTATRFGSAALSVEIVP